MLPITGSITLFIPLPLSCHRHNTTWLHQCWSYIHKLIPIWAPPALPGNSHVLLHFQGSHGALKYLPWAQKGTSCSHSINSHPVLSPSWTHTLINRTPADLSPMSVLCCSISFSLSAALLLPKQTPSAKCTVTRERKKTHKTTTTTTNSCYSWEEQAQGCVPSAWMHTVPALTGTLLSNEFFGVKATSSHYYHKEHLLKGKLEQVTHIYWIKRNKLR